MSRRFSTLLACAGLLLAAPVAAQLALPSAQLPGLPSTGTILDGPLGTAGKVLEGTTAEVTATLRQARLDRIDTLLRANRDDLERDAAGEPARKGTLLLVDPDPAALSTALGLGFAQAGTRQIEGLEIAVVELALPRGFSLAKAERLLRKALPETEIATDQIHFQSGQAGGAGAGFTHPAIVPVDVPIGIIDSAPGQPVSAVRGFARGAPLAADHGSAVVSLARWAGARKLLVADVYGNDGAGGSALAISSALGWLASSGARVVSISLVGPRNPLVERAVRAAQGRGIVIVAAVGNDGAASPPSYPASYGGVLAVTGVDRRNRPLIEAGKALHLDYAAPGADMTALDARGRRVAVRGTSFATPLVAVRAALALSRGSRAAGVASALDNEAVLISKRRPDPKVGRGLVCGVCR